MTCAFFGGVEMSSTYRFTCDCASLQLWGWMLKRCVHDTTVEGSRPLQSAWTDDETRVVRADAAGGGGMNLSSERSQLSCGSAGMQRRVLRLGGALLVRLVVGDCLEKRDAVPHGQALWRGFALNYHPPNLWDEQILQFVFCSSCTPWSQEPDPQR